MNNLAFRQGTQFVKSMEIMQREFIESLDIEERLRGIKPEDILSTLKPEEIEKLIKILPKYKNR
jgi:hypothetical protein